MEAVGWVMHKDDNDPVVLATTDQGDFLIRDNSFAHGRIWFVWESKDTTWDGTWVTDQYEQSGYILVVEPLQRFIPDSFIGNPVDQYEEDEVEATMDPLLEALTAELGSIRLPKPVSAYGLSIGPDTPHTYNDGNRRCAPAVTIAGKILA